MTEPVAVRKGFSFLRLEDGGVRVRVQTGERMLSGLEGGALDNPSVPTYRDVELTAAEWVDVMAGVSAYSVPSNQIPGGDAFVSEEAFRAAVDLHMGAPEGL